MITMCLYLYLFLIIVIGYFMCMSVLPEGMHVCHVRVWCLQRSEEGDGSPEIVVADGWEPLCGC